MIHWILIILSLLFAYLAYRVSAITQNGMYAGAILAILISIFGGWQFFLLLLVFVGFGAIFAKLPHQFSKHTDQHRPRDAHQILATIGIATIAIVLSRWFSTDAMLVRALLLAALAALATSFSDTLSAELGGRYGGTPRKLLVGKKLPSGESGGMTLFGLAVGALAAFGYAYLAMILNILPMKTEVNIAALALFGNVLDSVLGATLQSRYQCPICQQVSELKLHCHQKGKRITGSGLTNTGVNAVTTLVIALLTFVLYMQ